MNLSIGERIAMLRKERQITQTQLAEYLFLVPQTISKWEVGGGTPEISLLPRIAAFFGVSIDELFGMSDLERVENLVCRYSVLRDEQSFREASECLRSRRQAVEASLEKKHRRYAGIGAGKGEAGCPGDAFAAAAELGVRGAGIEDCGGTGLQDRADGLSPAAAPAAGHVGRGR